MNKNVFSGPLLIGVGLWLMAARAGAQAAASLDAALRVLPGDACLAESTLRARVRRWLKPGALSPGVRVVVDTAARPLSFSVERGGGVVARRSFPVLPLACDDRRDSVAIVIALAMENAARDPDADSAAPLAAEPDPVEQPQPARVAVLSTDADRAPSTDAARAPSAISAAPRMRMAGGGALLIGPLPEPAFAWSAGGAIVLAERWQLELSGLVVPYVRSSLGTSSFQTQLYGARALACLGTAPARLAFDGCAGALGALAVIDSNDFADHSTDTAWIAAIVRAAVRLSLSDGLALRIALDGFADIARPGLTVRRAGALTVASLERSPLGGAGSVDLVFTLP